MASLREELIRATELALAGDWDQAHKIVQSFETDQTACWIHACLHKLEPDESNSRYWYRRAGRPADVDADPQAELRTIRETLGD